jgi:hypothetical protein
MLEPSSNRSIARFLLPMADIMALLFSFFLLLPHLEQEPGKLAGKAVTPGSYWTPPEQQRVREELTRLRRQRLLPVDERLSIVVLDIDGDTGELLLTKGADVQRLNATNIDELIQRQQANAKSQDLELFYLLRVPRPGPQGTKPHPTVADEQLYRRWFGRRRVDYRIDHPRLQD